MTPKKTKKQLSLETLAPLAKEGVEAKPLLSQMELDTEELKRVGQEDVDRKLAELSPEDDKRKACPLCGKRGPVRVRLMERTFTSLSGTHTIRRHSSLRIAAPSRSHRLPLIEE